MRTLFLEILPKWLLMSRPGEKMKRNEQCQLKYNAKQKDMEMKERSSRSLLANVLDIDDDFRQHSCTMSSAGSGIGLSMGMSAGFPRVVSTPSGGLAPMLPMPQNQGNFIFYRNATSATSSSPFHPCSCATMFSHFIN